MKTFRHTRRKEERTRPRNDGRIGRSGVWIMLEITMSVPNETQSFGGRIEPNGMERDKSKVRVGGISP